VRFLYLLLGWLLALALVTWRRSCAFRIAADDPRPALRQRGQRYVLALLHAHQVSAVMLSDERMATMVSRSLDGDLLVPSLKMRNAVPVRGSSMRREVDKGGQRGLDDLAEEVSRGVPALIAVDGPRGPRNRVAAGIIELARRTGAVVIPVVVIPARRWILSRTWDRMQIPKAFTTIRAHFGPGVTVGPDAEYGEARAAIAEALRELERRHDPSEAARHAAVSALA
jgi:hypothetical protein